MQKLTANKKNLTTYLKKQGWLSKSEKIIAIEKPGDGNMNLTLRIDTGERTFIIKQSRAYVEKYPQVAAPEERALVEAEFYKRIATVPKLRFKMPRLIAVDTENNVLALEDLGKSSDYGDCYKKDVIIPKKELLKIMEFAATLHNSITTASTEEAIQNLKMRALNHEHIFIYPFVEDNGLDLDTILPGLKAAAAPFKEDEKLKEEVGRLGALYLENGNHLLHGDYFPGSWLKTDAGIKIIDPEFCFFGSPEFEIGVTIAHLKMADQSEALIRAALKHYTYQAPLEDGLREKFTAAEVLRRILGLAQLPLEIDLEKRVALMEEARGVLAP